MANAETLANLKLRAFDYADMPAASSVPADARMTNYVNAGLAVLYDILLDAGYFSKTADVALVAGTESYSLPADFYRVQEVSLLSGGLRYPLGRYERRELQGVHLGPRSAGTAKLDYAPQMTRLSSPSHTVDTAFPNGAQLPNGWEDYVAMYAASKLLGREESERWMAGDLAELKQHFIDMAGPQDTMGHTADIYSRWSSCCPPDSASSLRYRIIGAYIHFVELGYAGA